MYSKFYYKGIALTPLSISKREHPSQSLYSVKKMDNNTIDRETTRLWRANKTVHQLVQDRGYVVSQAELEMTLNEFVSTFAPTGSVLE